MTQAVISAHDWQLAAETVAPFAYDDEHLGPGYVHLAVAGGTAVWSARDDTRFARLVTNGAGSLDVLLPPRTVTAAATLASTTGSLTVGSGPGRQVSITDGTVGYHLDPPAVQPANVDELIDQCKQQPSVGVDVALPALRHLVDTATQVAACNQRREDEVPTLWLEIQPGELRLKVEWAGLGVANYRLKAATSGVARVAIGPRDLRQFCNALEAEDVHLEVPTNEGGMLLIQAGTWTAGSVAFRSGSESYRPDVEQVLSTVFRGWPLRRDRDGDYVLPHRSTPSYARLADGPPRLQIFAVALQDIELSPEMLAELNAINAGISLARIFAVDSQVLVEGEILADSIDPSTVAAVHESVDQIASETAPLLAAMFGGTAGVDAPLGREWTWQRYLETIIAIEASPGRWTDINGPNAADRLPLPEPIYVITASDPGGQHAGREANDDANADLAGELWATGATLARAVGRSPDGSHSEDSVAASPLSRQEAKELGRRYGQDAIYEVTAEAVLLLSCDTDRVGTIARRPEATAGDEPTSQ